MVLEYEILYLVIKIKKYRVWKLQIYDILT